MHLFVPKRHVFKFWVRPTWRTLFFVSFGNTNKKINLQWREHAFFETMNFPYFDQNRVEILNVSYPLFSFFGDSFFNSDVSQQKELSLLYLLVVTGKSLPSVEGARIFLMKLFYIFFAQNEISNVIFLVLFLCSRDMFFNFDSVQLKEIFFFASFGYSH